LVRFHIYHIYINKKQNKNEVNIFSVIKGDLENTAFILPTRHEIDLRHFVPLTLQWEGSREDLRTSSKSATTKTSTNEVQEADNLVAWVGAFHRDIFSQVLVPVKRGSLKVT
jgi:hypothetical protein